ncbi:type III secretion system export apparatus subunit SctR [Brucella intermedia]|uniref:type III secretion system export apparatus subunit SctR n=1 Tax=Brucella intermedia TaxID=94625 RepID=UPI00235DC7E2|nr:type III secretion system export apparatus subunit SctR [Brucella intermedia]
MSDNFPSVLPPILSVMALSMLPLLVVMGTAFTKISIVLSLMRNALGVQQAPSGLVINAIALTLTIFIMVPLADTILKQMREQNIHMDDWDGIARTFRIVSTAYSGYLSRHVSEKELAFFVDAAKKLWPQSMSDQITRDNIFILLPAHVTSELTKAFEISFLLFLPFVVIDLIVSNVLLSMGAMMVPPMLVSLPIKILLFVAADGWAQLLHNLVLSYV